MPCAFAMLDPQRINGADYGVKTQNKVPYQTYCKLQDKISALVKFNSDSVLP